MKPVTDVLLLQVLLGEVLEVPAYAWVETVWSQDGKKVIL